jgi:hypothetical protein
MPWCVRGVRFVVVLVQAWLLLVGMVPLAIALTVDAGPDQTVVLPVTDVTLFGQVDAPWHSLHAVQWRLLSGPAAVFFSQAEALTTTMHATAPGAYLLQLSVGNGGDIMTATLTVTLEPPQAQTAFYVDPTYTGTVQNGSAAQPWRDFREGNSQYAAQWQAINAALLKGPTIVYISARQAATDAPEVINGRIKIDRLPRGLDPSPHRLVIDGMSKYNTNDATPVWGDYAGPQKTRIAPGSGSLSIGWQDDQQRDHVTIRGFEVTGRGARIRWGGHDSVLEHIWSHDVSGTGATVQFNQAMSDHPECRDLGKSERITVRNNRIERGIGEGLYIAGNYRFTTWGGCPSYGNTHKNILIEGNTIVQAGLKGDQGDGIDLKAGLMNVTVRDNIIERATAAGSWSGNGGDGIVCEGVFPPALSNYLFERNRIFSGTGYGIMVGSVNGAVVRNNVMYANRGGLYLSGEPQYPAFSVAVYNNTVHGQNMLIGETHGIAIRNNLIFGFSTNRFAIDGWHFSGLDSDYNLFAPRGSALPEGSHTLVRASNEGIVASRTTGNFHLSEPSAARDRGVSLTGTGFATDYEGKPRPLGPAWDVGGYED